MARVAFIGLGNMGRPMAANIRRRQFPLTVFDLAPGPVAAAISHHTISAVETISAFPVIRVRIEVTEVHCGR